MSPSGDSILITSAPRSPRICVASGPRTTVVRSSTLVPESGPGLASLTAPPGTSSSPSHGSSGSGGGEVYVGDGSRTTAAPKHGSAGALNSLQQISTGHCELTTDRRGRPALNEATRESRDPSTRCSCDRKVGPRPTCWVPPVWLGCWGVVCRQ